MALASTFMSETGFGAICSGSRRSWPFSESTSRPERLPMYWRALPSWILAWAGSWVLTRAFGSTVAVTVMVAFPPEPTETVGS